VSKQENIQLMGSIPPCATKHKLFLFLFLIFLKAKGKSTQLASRL